MQCLTAQGRLCPTAGPCACAAASGSRPRSANRTCDSDRSYPRRCSMSSAFSCATEAAAALASASACRARGVCVRLTAMLRGACHVLHKVCHVACRLLRLAAARRPPPRPQARRSAPRAARCAAARCPPPRARLCIRSHWHSVQHSAHTTARRALKAFAFGGAYRSRSACSAASCTRAELREAHSGPRGTTPHIGVSAFKASEVSQPREDHARAYGRRMRSRAQCS